MKEKPNFVAETISVPVELVVFRKFGSGRAQRPRPRNHFDRSWAGVDVILIRGGYANICVRSLKTLLYYPLLQSRRHGPRAPNAE